MNRALTFEQKKLIETKAEQGWTSQQLADELGTSIWTVRKWRSRIKKGVHLN